MRYDANGERIYKLTGQSILGQVNSGSIKAQAIFDDAVLYPNPYVVVTSKGYTKHYYAGTERIATVIGTGGFDDMVTTIDNLSSQHDQNIIKAFYSYYQNYDPFFYQKIVSQPEKTEDIFGKPSSDLDYHCTPTELVMVDILNPPDILFKSISVNEQNNGPEKEVYFYHGDHLGSANWITDYTGAPVQYIHYAPYGELIDNQAPYLYDERYKFTGKERDQETGYDFFGARFYWQAGTWLSVDPLADENPDKSPYAYCSWNPISRIDPDGRADYYDVDGNHLCNDGVNDRKVYQQSDKGDKVLCDYATPFSYVGDVDRISLSYIGEMVSRSNCISKGELTVTQHVGEKQFSKSFDAVSGSNGKKGPLYTLQNGDYICYGYVSYDPAEIKDSYVKDGIGFGIFLKTTSEWTTQRTGLMIHPDGGASGTAGCIGLTGTASDLSLFQKMVSPFMSGGNTSPLSVSIIGNPQCCRAANYDKGVPALFCK